MNFGISALGDLGRRLANLHGGRRFRGNCRNESRDLPHEKRTRFGSDIFNSFSLQTLRP